MSANLAEPHLSGRQLRLTRAAWFSMLVMVAVIFAVGVPLRFAQLRAPASALANGQDDELLPADAVRALTDVGISPEGYAIFILALASAGTVLALVINGLLLWRGANQRGTILIAVMLAWSSLQFIPAPGNYPALEWLLRLARLFQPLSYLAFFLVLPDGRFVPRRSSWLFVGMLAILGWSTLLAGTALAMPEDEALSSVLWFSFVLLVFAAQVYRYARVSGPTERGQIRWVVYTIVVGLIINLPFVIFDPRPDSQMALYVLGRMANYLFLIALQAAVLIAVLRYRLWDIDLLIRRTLVYAVITGLLAAVYFGSVIILQAIVRGISGQQQSTLAIVISTLGIAALFAPLRSRVQMAVDRRFYRRKYDAAQTVADFGAIARNEVELDSLVGLLKDAVTDTLEPQHVSLSLVQLDR